MLGATQFLVLSDCEVFVTVAKLTLSIMVLNAEGGPGLAGSTGVRALTSP